MTPNKRVLAIGAVVVACLLIIAVSYRLDSTMCCAQWDLESHLDHDAYTSFHMYKEASSREKACKAPFGGFKAWKQGVVTVVRPQVATDRNCSKIIAGDTMETSRVRSLTIDWKSGLSDEHMHSLTMSCSWLVAYFQNNLYNTQLELNFPIAFSFVVYESPEQFLRLLKLLYRPQNVYCIHPDKKSKYHSFFSNFARCFHNVIIAREIHDVRWGYKTLLMAQMSCLSDLIDHRSRQRDQEKWRYVINLCGKELPLLSNAEMVKKLISLNGTSAIHDWSIPKTEGTYMRLQGKILPYNLTLYKSMTYNGLSVEFVNFILKNSTARNIYEFFMGVDFPEEHFYCTLFRMPGVPGGYNSNIPDDNYFEVGHYFWRTNQQEVLLPCFGKTVHAICVVNCADLPRIMSETENGKIALFQNKYFMEEDHVAMDCMEERIVAMNKKEFQLECPGR